MTDIQNQPQNRNQRAQRPAPERPHDPRLTAVQARATRIRAIFDARGPELVACFPDGGATMVARAKRSAITIAAGMTSDATLNVTAESVCSASLAALHLGLEPGTDAYIYPYKNDAKLIVGPQGLIKLAMRSGFVEAISARPVFAADHFEYDFGTGEISHRKAEQGRRPVIESDRGLERVPEQECITHAYAIVYMKGGAKTFEVLTAEDLAFYRSFSKASRGPWYDNFGGMARKTAIKRALALVPIDALTASALRETEEGAYQLPAEIDAIVERAIAKRDGRQMPEPPPEETEEAEPVPAAREAAA